MHDRTLKTPLLILVAVAGLVLGCAANAHFQMIIPADDMVKQGESRRVDLNVLFWHPLEGLGMNMQAPVQFGVMLGGKKTDLVPTLNAEIKRDRVGQDYNVFKTRYAFKKPGDHIFYIEPQPYWEAAEQSFIIHYTKVVVNGFGLEDGWDEEVGFKTEITPLTRPYGLWAGNVFQGVVKVNGEPVPFSEVEVEFYDQVGKIAPPADPMITQVVKADANGVFTYVMPWEGWWGFAALNEDEQTMQHEGKDYPVEIGAVLWVKTHAKPW